MDYKEKYKAAIERAKEELGSGCFNKGSIEYIFPELKVSEDERIRVAITRFLLKNGKYAIEMYGCTIKEATDWLEKQGKQEWTDKDEELFISYSNNVLDLWKKEYAEEFINWIGTLKQRLQ